MVLDCLVSSWSLTGSVPPHPTATVFVAFQGKSWTHSFAAAQLENWAICWGAQMFSGFAARRKITNTYCWRDPVGVCPRVSTSSPSVWFKAVQPQAIFRRLGNATPMYSKQSAVVMAMPMFTGVSLAPRLPSFPWTPRAGGYELFPKNNVPLVPPHDGERFKVFRRSAGNAAKPVRAKVSGGRICSSTVIF